MKIQPREFNCENSDYEENGDKRRFSCENSGKLLKIVDRNFASLHHEDSKNLIAKITNKSYRNVNLIIFFLEKNIFKRYFSSVADNRTGEQHEDAAIFRRILRRPEHRNDGDSSLVYSDRVLRLHKIRS